MMKMTAAMFSCLMFASVLANEGPKTELKYLSGHGCDDMVEWDFKCTDGRNSGKWTKIGVPSCWELQGFGTYQYGMRFYGKAFPEGVANEQGLYKYEFCLPEEWRNKQIELVFEAVMTDAKVQINGRKAGDPHQGGFNRFSYNVSDRVFFGDKKNVLEVTVSKESENAGVNLSERRADYWNFGGIIRPVFVRMKPVQNIRRFAIDAEADGSFLAECFLNMAVENARVEAEIKDLKGKVLAKTSSVVRPGSDFVTLSCNVDNPDLWTAETPNLYIAELRLIDSNGKVLHEEADKFGFRSIEVREGDGLYINGKRVNIRGVNRHSFRPESGRTLSKAKNIEDVLLIKSMNMNSVRLSHYAADPEFLEACDSLGLYVMNELSGWHGKHDTPTGRKLIESLVTRDVNHPSVIWWSNGNEQGWNTELDCEFAKYDLQSRPVIHPQGNFGGFETMHYRSYGESQNYMRKPELFMPTEFLHGLYDGGHGAGLWDYWEMMRRHPRCVGGFLWVLADEGVVRVDMDGFIDNQGNFGADGIVGPHHEKEGSYYTVKQIWCPVQIVNSEFKKDFDGKLQLENRYDFLNLNSCKFIWKYVSYPNDNASDMKVKVLRSGEMMGPNIPAHESGYLSLPKPSSESEALLVSVVDYSGEELFSWTFVLNELNKRSGLESGKSVPTYNADLNTLMVNAGDKSYSFDKKTGYLKNVVVNGKTINFSNGPRFFAVRRGDRSLDQFYNHDDQNSRSYERQYVPFEDMGRFVGLDVKEENGNLVVTSNYTLGCLDVAKWTISSDGNIALDYTYNFSGVVDMIGVTFDYPEDKMLKKQWLGDGPYRVWQNRLHGPQYGVWANDYNDPIPGESFIYPEFKGYFANVSWMKFFTEEGQITLKNETPNTYIGVYQPRDGRDKILYTFPETGISVLNVIPPVRNKVNTTDLCGPSSQPAWVDGKVSGRLLFRFE